METPPLDKRSLRALIKRRVEGLSLDERRRESLTLLSRLEGNKLFADAKVVLLYWSLPDEVCTHEFILKWCDRKQILLPAVISAEEMELRLFKSEKETTQDSFFGITQACGEPYTNYSSIDLAIIPGRAFTAQGARLGRGRGYYDRLLPHIPAPKVGLAFSCQILPFLETMPHDIMMDSVLCL